MICRIFPSLLLLGLPSIAIAQMDVQNTRYTCERGVEVPVVYASSGDSAIAALVIEGNQILLYSEATASGARYAWPSGGSNYVWLTKDTQGMLLWRDGATKTETTLLATCKQN